MITADTTISMPPATPETERRSGDSCPAICSASLPPVLDACCGPRGMWFDKKDARAIFVDCREENFGKIADGMTLIISPDIKADFSKLPFPDASFFHVVFDPPHCNGTRARLQGCIGMKYGLLFAGWEEMLRDGFSECFRVLKPNGTLIFKWNEQEIPVNDILKLTPEKPLYGHRSGKSSKTHWIAFMKPNDKLRHGGENQNV